jgi:hypothetical protein
MMTALGAINNGTWDKYEKLNLIYSQNKRSSLYKEQTNLT